MVKSLSLSLIFCAFVSTSFAQAPPPPLPDISKWAEDTVKPCHKDPALPSFNIRMMDSVTIFNTFNIPRGKKTGIIFFDPECKHCKTTITALLKGMDSVKDIDFYMVTPMAVMSVLRKFYADYHLADYKNIRLVGRDYGFFFFEFYRAMSIPDIALYDENKKLIKLVEGEFTASDLYKLVH